MFRYTFPSQRIIIYSESHEFFLFLFYYPIDVEWEFQESKFNLTIILTIAIRDNENYHKFPLIQVDFISDIAFQG